MSTLWIKAYVHDAKLRTTPGEQNMRDVRFTKDVRNASHYESEEEAQIDVRLIFKRGVDIEMVDGKHRLKDFKVEERAPTEFVISVEVLSSIFGK